MTRIDRPVLRELLRMTGAERTLQLLRRIEGTMHTSRDLDGALSGFANGAMHLRASGSRITGTLTYDDTSIIKWDDGMLNVWRVRMKAIPQTLMFSMVGRPVTDMVDWDRLDARMTITDMDEEGVYFRMSLRDYAIDIGDGIQKLEAGTDI